MIHILSRHPLLTLALIERFGLTASISFEDVPVYSNDFLSVIDLEEHLPLSILKTEFFSDSDRIFVVSFAFGVSNERYIGDVVLPNAFLALHPELVHSEVTENNADSFFYDSLFLTQYIDQKDYDFGKFSMSVGGICASGGVDITDDTATLEKIRIAYEPDSYDTSSLETVRYLRQISGRDDIYVIQGLLTGEKPSNAPVEDIERYVAENVVNITKFFIDNFLEGDGEIRLKIK